MAAALGLLQAISASRLPSLPPSASLSDHRSPSCLAPVRHQQSRAGRWTAMMPPQTFQGPPSSVYAREMERLSAKEALLIAFKDVGGFQSLLSGKTTEWQRIDVNERIVCLERLNPTSRPTTSPYLEGRWNFEWISASSPGSFAARFLVERSPATLANLVGLDVLLKDGYAKITTNLMFLNAIQSKFLLTTKLSVEGPMRMKEEYVEGTFETPTVFDDSIPEQLKGPLGQAVGSLQKLPVPIRDTFANGLKVPLGGTFQRIFLISYLDEEIMIMRDSSGAPDVLTRLEAPPAQISFDPMIPEYQS